MSQELFENIYGEIPIPNEMDRLLEMLSAMRGTPDEIQYDITECQEQPQVIIYDNEKLERLNDAVCHFGSYGHEQGLLECWEADGDDVVGWLTAEKTIEIFRKTIELNRQENK